MTASRKRAAKPAVSQRERLLGRQRPTLAHRVLVDADAVTAAREALAKAQREHRPVMLKSGSGSPAAKVALRKVEAAEAAVDACYETIMLRALPPRRIEELADQHPPTPEQMAKLKAERDKAQQRSEQPPDWPSWNEDTFWPALLAESVDGDMSVEDWAQFLAGNVSDGEGRSLKQAALAVNHQERVADPLVLPKGLTQMIS